jgi:hypothetical protein
MFRFRIVARVAVVALMVTAMPVEETPAVPIFDSCTVAMISFGVAQYNYNQCLDNSITNPCANEGALMDIAANNVFQQCGFSVY